jgi:hypothetical protein
VLRKRAKIGRDAAVVGVVLGAWGGVLGAWASALDTISVVDGSAKDSVASPRMEKIFRRERISGSLFSLMSRSPLWFFCRNGVILRRCDAR